MGELTRSQGNHEFERGTTDRPLRLTHEYGSFSSQSLRSHALLEKRNGLLVDFLASEATGTAERDAASALLDEARERGFHLVNHQEL